MVFDASFDPTEIPFGFAQGRLSLRLKDGSARDDANDGVMPEEASGTLSKYS